MAFKKRMVFKIEPYPNYRVVVYELDNDGVKHWSVEDQYREDDWLPYRWAKLYNRARFGICTFDYQKAVLLACEFVQRYINGKPRLVMIGESEELEDCDA